MKKHYSTTSILFLLLVIFCAHGNAAEIETQHFTIHYEGGEDLYAGLVADQAEAGYSLVAGLLDHGIEHNVDIVIAPTMERFAELTEGRLPDWSAAVAIGNDTIVLSSLEGHKQDMEHVLTHEIAHIIINNAAREQPVPRWFHEGVAETVSGGLGIRGRVYLIIRSARNDLLTFRDIQNVFASDQSDATLAYDQSMLAVRQMVEQFGQPALADMLSRMEEGESFERAFRNITGSTVPQFEQEYLASIRQRYGYGSLVSSLLNTWTIILIVAVLVFIVQRIRTRRIMRRWEDEESDSRIVNFPDDLY